MKILVLNGSPRPNGNTASMVEAFAEGAKENGHEIIVVRYAKRKLRDVWPVNTAIPKERAGVSSRMICRKSIRFFRRQR